MQERAGYGSTTVQPNNYMRAAVQPFRENKSLAGTGACTRREHPLKKMRKQEGGEDRLPQRAHETLRPTTQNKQHLTRARVKPSLCDV